MVAVFCVVWGLITHGTFAGSGDEPHYMLVSHSIAFDHDLDLTNNYRDAHLITAGTLKPEAHAIERHGQLRPVHDIGMPLLFSPVVGLAYESASFVGQMVSASTLDRLRLTPGLLFRHQLSLVMALVAALLAREIYLAAIALGSTPRAAIASSLLFALSPPIVAHSFLFFTELPSALIAFVVFRRLCITSTLADHGRAMSLVLGLLVGALIFVHVRNVGLAIGLVMVGLQPALLRSRSRALAFMSGVLCSLGLRTASNLWLWGSLVTTPHAALGSVDSFGTVLTEVATRAGGLLFDREYGLLAYAPIYIAALPGLIRACHRGALGWHVAVVTGAYLLPVLLPITNVHGWTGGWSPAARFLVPVAPLLWVVLWQYLSRTAGVTRGVAGLVVCLQVWIDAYVWQFPKTLWNDGDGATSLWMARWLPSLQETQSITWVAVLMAVWLTTGIVMSRSRHDAHG